MTPARLDRLIHRIDQKARRQADNVWQFQVRNRTLIVVTDASADRMRVMTPIVDAAYLEPEIHERMLQANFDTALDARYAIGNGTLWGVFVHTLHDLTPELFLSAAGQVHNVAETFGKTYTSGALMFGTGDSGDLQRRLLEELQSLHQQST